MRRAIEAFASLRMTLVLLCALAVLFLVGQAVPQRALLQRDLYEAWRSQSPAAVAVLERLELTDVYRSSAAWAIWAMFFLNLAVVMARRLPGTLRRIRLEGEIPDPAGAAFVARRTLAAPGVRPGDVVAFFERRGLAVQASGDRIRAVRNRAAPLATVVFHLSFFVIAAGAWITAATRFEGVVDLGEGEAFTGDLGQYAHRPSLPRFGDPPRVRFQVEAIEPEVAGNLATAIRIRVRDEAGAPQVFEVNHPYRASGTSFVYKNLGVAPLLVIRDATGRERFAGFMRLDVLLGKEDAFQLLGHRFSARLFPDYAVEGGFERSRSQEMRDPVLRLTVTDPGGRELTQALRPGDVMPLGPYALTFADWRYWVRLYVRAERGLWVLWLGFAAGAAAVALRLLRYRREFVAALVATPDGAALSVGARAEYYRALFVEEAERTFRELEAELASRGDGAPPGGADAAGTAPAAAAGASAGGAR